MNWTFNEVQMLLNKTNGKVVGDLMTPAPVVRETTNLEDSVRLLLETKYRRLPVVDADGKLVGIITRGNVVRAALQIKHAMERKADLSARPCDALNLDGDLVESDDDCSMSFVVKLVAEPNSGGALHDVIPLKSKPGPRKVNALVNKPELPYHAVAKNNDLASGRQVVHTILKKIRVGVEGLMAKAKFSCQVGSGDLTSSERVKPMRLAPWP
ncbi:hypothetical protein NC651_013535 [Populus alba x Populus x berolinensis]|nr:hypothetical protein NC651_013535 [Populus alba x Populus x berolinensis]